MDSNDHSPERPAGTGPDVGDARRVVVDGVRQTYRVVGEGPFCLVHPGGPGVHPEYLRMPALAHDLTLVYLDPVGSGDSDPLPDGDYSPARYARFAEAVLNDLGAPTAYFLGHSHGGFVAQQFALDHPERLDGLILYDTAPVYGKELTDTATAKMAALARRRADRPELVNAARAWKAMLPGGLAYDDASHERHLNTLLPAYYADYRRTSAEAGGLALRVTPDPNRRPVAWDVRDRLGMIEAPALVIVGLHDFICPPRYAYELDAGIADTRLCALPESGHFGHIEEPDAFTAAVLEFVDNQKRNPS